MSDIFDCILAGWSPGIGDPTWQGWSTTVLYVFVAIVALMTARHAKFPEESHSRERAFWLTLATVLGLLAINKQLDLQSALTEAGRCAAHAQGWYDQRRSVQIAFLGILATISLLFLGALLMMMHGTLKRTALPATGLAFVLCFVLMRAVGFHYFDHALGRPVMGIRMNMILEWTGPILILCAAIMNMRDKGRPTASAYPKVQVAPLRD